MRSDRKHSKANLNLLPDTNLLNNMKKVEKDSDF